MEFNLNFKPAIKKSNSASVTQDGTVIIGVVPEYSVEIEIQEEWISDLICLLDGNHSINQIASILAHKGYDIDDKNIIEVLEYLSDSNLLEDSQEYQRCLQSNILSSHEADRYNRQILLFQSLLGKYEFAFDAQQKLKNTRVSLIGLGGIGSYAFYGLSAMGFGFIRGIDFDTVDVSNLSRQILYSEGDVGKFKVDVAKEKAHSINSTIDYEFLNFQINTVEDAIKVFQDVDFIIVAADIPRGKIWQMLSEAAFKTNKPALFLGSAQTWVCCGPLIVPTTTPCYDCSCPELTHTNHPVAEFIKERYTTTLIDPYNAIAASLGLLEAVKYITNIQECRVIGKRLLLDLGTYETFFVSGEKKEGCSICSAKGV